MKSKLLLIYDNFLIDKAINIFLNVNKIKSKNIKEIDDLVKIKFYSNPKYKTSYYLNYQLKENGDTYIGCELIINQYYINVDLNKIYLNELDKLINIEEKIVNLVMIF